MEDPDRRRSVTVRRDVGRGAVPAAAAGESPGEVHKGKKAAEERERESESVRARRGKTDKTPLLLAWSIARRGGAGWMGEEN